MVRVYQWHSRTGVGTGLAFNGLLNVDLLEGTGSAGDTVIRTIVHLSIAGTLGFSSALPAVARMGVQVADASPADPFGSPEVNDTEWLWLGHEQLVPGTAAVDTIRTISTTSWSPAVDSRAARVLGVDESVWLSARLSGLVLSGTWNYSLTARVLLLLPG